MATTNLGVYYPGANDNVDWPAIFSTIASSVDNLITEITFDSGWVPITNFHGNWASRLTTTVGRASIRRVGKFCSCSGLVEASAGADVKEVFTVPLGFENDVTYCFTVLRGASGFARMDLNGITKTFEYRPNLSTATSFYSLGSVKYLTGVK